MESIGKYLDERTTLSTSKPDVNNGYPGVLQAIGLLVLWTLIQLAIGIFLMAITGVSKALLRPVILLLIEFASLGPLIAYDLRRSRVRLSEMLPFKRVPARLLAPMVLCIIGTFSLSVFISAAVRNWFPPPHWVSDLFSDLVRGRWGYSDAVLALVILGPLAEELFFRGLVLRGFLHRYGPRRAVLFSALLFGAYHLNVWQFSYATLLGLLLGWWFVETRSLLPCFIGHAFFNSIPLILVAVAHLVPGNWLASAPDPGVWLIVGSVVILSAGIFLLKRSFRAANQGPVAE